MCKLSHCNWKVAKQHKKKQKKNAKHSLGWLRSLATVGIYVNRSTIMKWMIIFCGVILTPSCKLFSQLSKPVLFISPSANLSQLSKSISFRFVVFRRCDFLQPSANFSQLSKLISLSSSGEIFSTSLNNFLQINHFIYFFILFSQWSILKTFWMKCSFFLKKREAEDT